MADQLRWEIPEYALYGLGMILLLILAVSFYQRWLRRTERVFSTEAQEKLSGFSRKKGVFNPYLLWIPFILMLTLALMNPQTEGGTETREIEGTDIFIALDISSSMLAKDVAPSRIDRAKHFSTQLVREMQGNRIGLIFFAGSAFKQSPLTSDYSSLLNMINAASPYNAGVQGTNIGEAVRLASGDENSKNTESAKALIIITDGEDHDENALEAVREAAAKGLGIYVVGVGTESGGPIPDYSRGINSYKTDETGQPVVTKLNIEMCKAIAREGNGKAYILNSITSVTDDLQLEVDRLEKRTTQSIQYKLYKSYFPWFLLAGMLLFIVLTFKEYRS